MNGHNTTRLSRHTLPAVFMRAGTSKGLFIKASDLPEDRELWHEILLGAMGSPDPFGRQLNGVGSGTPTTSKIAVIGPSPLEDVDVDYTFVAVPIGGDRLDFSGNCGNMASGVAPFAIEAGLVNLKKPSGEVSVKIRNTNTGVIMRSTLEVRDGIPLEAGSCILDGVPESGAPIKLDFLNPSGAMTGKLLPSGNSIDEVQLESKPNGFSSFQVSLIDAANPFVYVRAADLGLTGNEAPAALIKHIDTLMAIRCAAAVKMGLAPDVATAALTAGTPKIAIVGPPAAYVTPAGRQLKDTDMNLTIRSFGMGAPHPTLQMTGAVCLAAACAVPGSIPNQIVTAGSKKLSSPLRVAHASGILEIESDLEINGAGTVIVHSGSVYRTARRLFEGNVAYLAKEVVSAPIAKSNGVAAHHVKHAVLENGHVTMPRMTEVA